MACWEILSRSLMWMSLIARLGEKRRLRKVHEFQAKHGYRVKWDIIWRKKKSLNLRIRTKSVLNGWACSHLGYWEVEKEGHLSSGISNQPVPHSEMLYPKVNNNNGGRGFSTKVARSQSSLILLKRWIAWWQTRVAKWQRAAALGRVF